MVVCVAFELLEGIQLNLIHFLEGGQLALHFLDFSVCFEEIVLELGLGGHADYRIDFLFEIQDFLFLHVDFALTLHDVVVFLLNCGVLGLGVSVSQNGMRLPLLLQLLVYHLR